MVQKTHGNGKETRYFWIVSVKGDGTMTYRSRHATSAGVRSEFRRAGHTVTGIRVAQA